MSARLFPIMGLSYRAGDDIRYLRSKGCISVIIAVPWALLEPHEEQAQRNHGQTLKRLAERGGLGPDEALAVLEDRRYRQMGQADANKQLLAAVERFIATLAQPPEGQPDAHPTNTGTSEQEDGRDG